jgi:hypothetical protein
VQEECRARLRRAGDEGFIGDLLRNKAGACPGGGLGGLGGLEELEEIKAAGPTSVCLFFIASVPI